MGSLRGWIGEQETKFELWLTLSSKTYRRVHNVIIPSKNGTTQIDHILISRYGLFIIETKNKKGWIYGSEDQATWTQTLYKKKFKFQNPLRQTFRQKLILSEFLEINKSLIYPLIYFVGDSTFKTNMPTNVINSWPRRYIKSFRTPIIPEMDVVRILDTLKRHKLSSKLKNRDHIRSLKERHSSKTICPKCGSRLVVKTAKRGAQAGSKFLGCADYPRCKFTRNL
jgi:hypothetical protein